MIIITWSKDKGRNTLLKFAIEKNYGWGCKTWQWWWATNELNLKFDHVFIYINVVTSKGQKRQVKKLNDANKFHCLLIENLWR